MTALLRLPLPAEKVVVLHQLPDDLCSGEAFSDHVKTTGP